MRKRTTYAPAPVVSAYSPNSNNNTGENEIKEEIIKIFKNSFNDRFYDRVNHSYKRII